MYYPKSQIKESLYTKGKEYTLVNTEKEYKGYYYLTSNGDAYTGKYPGDGDNYLLTKLLEPITAGNETQNSVYTFSSNFYSQKKNITNFSAAPQSPKSSNPIPTENDYKIGEFQRYFLKKTNESIFLEVSQLTYNQYLSRNSSVQYELYMPLSTSWVLTGDKKRVYQINYNNILRVEQDNKIQGFIEYFKGRFTRFYK